MSELDAIFQALAARRRRIALQCLLEHGTVALPDLAELVVERETGEDITTISPERVRQVYFSLYHTHVPRLENADLARYEQEEDLVRATGQGVEALNRTLDEVDALLP